jgi:hypothetical protein
VGRVGHPWQQVPDKNLFLEDVVKRAIDEKIMPFVDIGATYRGNVNSLESTEVSERGLSDCRCHISTTCFFYI